MSLEMVDERKKNDKKRKGSLGSLQAQKQANPQRT